MKCKPFVLLLACLACIKCNTSYSQINSAVVDSSIYQGDDSLLNTDSTFFKSKNTYSIATFQGNAYLYTQQSYIYSKLQFEPGQQFVFKDTSGDFVPVIFGDVKGYVAKIAIAKKTSYPVEKIRTFKYHTEYGTYDYIPKKEEERAEYYDGSSLNNPKTVNVKGYLRKDGTYVRPYTRSAPHKH